MSEQTHHDEFYGENADFFHSPLFRARHERDAKVVKRFTPPGARVLSLGCGEGGLELHLAADVRHVLGIDLSAEAIELARRQAEDAGVHNLDYRQADVLETALPTGSFDAVWGLAFLHHLPVSMVAPTLNRVHDWLRPGGRLVTIDPSSRRLVRHLAGLVKSSYEEHHSPDERELDPEEVVTAVRAAGFSDVRVVWTDFAAGPLAWLRPTTPVWAARGVVAIDSALVKVPVIQKYSSGYAVTAVA